MQRKAVILTGIDIIQASNTQLLQFKWYLAIHVLRLYPKFSNFSNIYVSSPVSAKVFESFIVQAASFSLVARPPRNMKTVSSSVWHLGHRPMVGSLYICLNNFSTFGGLSVLISGSCDRCFRAKLSFFRQFGLNNP